MGKKNTMSTIVRAALLHVIVITALALMKCTYYELCLPLPTSGFLFSLS